MSDAQDDRHPAAAPHRRPHPQSMALPYMEFDFDAEIAQLHREPEWATGQNAKTLVKHADFRIVLIALKAHAKIPGQRTDGRISIQTVRGRIAVRAEGRAFDLPVGRLLAFDRAVPHDVEAHEESAFVLTIAWRGAPA